MKTDVFIAAILHNEKIKMQNEQYKERVKNKILRPTREWMSKLVSAYPKTAAAGKTLDEKTAAVIQTRFMKEVLLATYGQLRLSESYRAKFPETAGLLSNIYATQEE